MTNETEVKRERCTSGLVQQKGPVSKRKHMRECIFFKSNTDFVKQKDEAMKPGDCHSRCSTYRRHLQELSWSI